MDGTHIHLLITHLPVFGSMLGAIILMYALRAKSDSTKKAAYIVFILSAAGACTAYLTGESAEHTVRQIDPGAKAFIHPHEDVAMYALISLIVLAVSAIISWYLTNKKTALAVKFAVITLIISLISFGLVSWTAYLGGQVRHTEIRAVSTAAP